MKYRIKVEHRADGTKRYRPQWKELFMWCTSRHYYDSLAQAEVVISAWKQKELKLTTTKVTYIDCPD